MNGKAPDKCKLNKKVWGDSFLIVLNFYERFISVLFVDWFRKVYFL